MSLKRYHYNNGHRLCYTCKYIDEYALNTSAEGEIPHGYDGTAFCCRCDEDKEITAENRMWISPCWEVCHKYERCTERQADYLDIFDNETQTIIINPNKITKNESKD